MIRRSLLPLCVWAFLGLLTTALAQPVILNGPQGFTNVAPGSDVLLFVVANSDTAETNYQWQLNGANIPGATNASLEYPSVQAANGGLYDVMVDDGQFALKSEIVDVLVNIGSVITNNDNFSNRYVLPSSVIIGAVRCVNTNATKESNEVAIIAGDPGGKSVWFEWTATNSGNVTFSTQGSDFDTILGAYPEFQIRPRNAPPRVTGNDDGGEFFTSLITFAATSNSTYYVIVDGHYGASGNIVLGWYFDPLAPPVPTITASPPAIIPAELNEAVTLAVTNDIGAWLWLSNGIATLDTQPTYSIPVLSDSDLALYQVQITSSGGTVRAPPSRIELNELEDGSVAFNSIAFAKFVDAAHAAFNQPLPVGNHVKTGGGDTRGYTVSQTFSTVGAQSESGEPVVCQQPGGAPMWYAYVTPTNGDMEIDTIGSAFNTILGVYTGTGASFGSLTNLGCGYTTNRGLNGQPQVFISNVPKSQTNFIVIDGERAATGIVQLNIAIGAPVEIVSGLTNQSATPGSTISFIVTATGSTPMTYAWQNQNGSVGDGEAVLTLTNLTSADAGTYTVTVNNAVSQASASAVLTVFTPPIITNQPADLTVNAGGTASFSCGVNGTPPFAFKWLYQKSDVVGFNSSLVLTNVKTTAAGGYSCIITNIAGAATSRVAMLTVDVPPQITSQPASRTVSSNATAVLNVSATGAPPPDYQWWFNGATLGPDAAALSVSNFSAANQGAYVVVVTNSAGAATSAPANLVLDAPLRFNSSSYLSNAFRGELIGAVNQSYVIQNSTDLVSWLPWLTNSSTNGFLDFVDTNPPVSGSRFFRGTTN